MKKMSLKTLTAGAMALVMLTGGISVQTYAMEEAYFLSEDKEDILSEGEGQAEFPVEETTGIPTGEQVQNEDQEEVGPDDMLLDEVEKPELSEEEPGKDIPEETLSENLIDPGSPDETYALTESVNEIYDLFPDGAGQPFSTKSTQGTATMPQIVTIPSSDEKTLEVRISVQVGYICYTTDGKKPTYDYGFPGKGTTCVRDINCTFKLKGETEYTIQAMNVTPDGKVSAINKVSVTLEPKIRKLQIDGPKRVVPGKTVTYKISTNPQGRKPANVVWSLDFPKGSIIEEYVTIDEKTGKVKIEKNNITTSAVTLSNDPVFYVYATAVEGSNVIKSEKYAVSLADVETVSSMKFTNKAISLKRGSINKTYKKTDEAYRGVYESGLIIYSPNDDVPMTDKDIEKNIIFSSSDEEVATVDKYGGITAKKAGTAVIRAMSDDRLKKAEMKVTVIQEITKDPQITSEYDRYTLAAGKKMTMSAKSSPEDATMDLIWSVSPADCGVSISKKGVVSASKKAFPGEYTVTATDSVSGRSGSKTVKVVAEAVSRINMSDDAKNLMICRTGKNDSVSFSVFFDKNQTEYTVTTDRPGLVNVSVKDIKDKGCAVTVKATGYASGLAKVTVKATDGSNKAVTSRVLVTEEDFELILTQEKGIREMYTGTTLSLKGNVYSTDGTKINRKISWGISPAGQGVTVSKAGTVSAAKNAKGGIYTVTCAINNQLQCASYDIRVNPRCTTILVGNDYDPKTNKLTAEYKVALGSAPISKLQLYNGTSNIELKPIDETVPVKIRNSNPSVAEATISSKNGEYYLTIKGKSRGSTQITLTANDGSGTKRKFKVNVQ